jgi:diguanylate cyclase (GGDEF)-like protein
MRTQEKIPFNMMLFTVIGLLLPILNELILNTYIDDVTADHLSEIFWFVTLIPSVLFSYYYGLRGALLIAMIGLLLNFSFEIIDPDHGERLHTIHVYSFVLVVFLHFAVVFSVGIMADKLLMNEKALIILNGKLEQISLMDELTGLLNRRGFMSTASDSLIHAKESCCIFIDIDGFKPVNDQYGHEYGDRLLIQLAKRLQTSIRDNDFVARLGGDEFVCLLSNASRQTAEEIAIRIKQQLTSPIHLYGYEFAITASIGISVFPHHGKSIEELIKKADKAMYLSKKKGKNQLTFYQERHYDQ